MQREACPTCGAYRGELSKMICYDPWHERKPELMFSFRMPTSRCNAVVSETQLMALIDSARLGRPFCSMGNQEILAAAAECMIEMTKAPAPKLKLNPSKSIREQIADLLREVGLEPSRFLNNPEKDIKPMCGAEGVSNFTSKQLAEEAARQLVAMLKRDLDITVQPLVLRLWLQERWDEVAKHAHKIHGAK